MMASFTKDHHLIVVSDGGGRTTTAALLLLLILTLQVFVPISSTTTAAGSSSNENPHQDVAVDTTTTTTTTGSSSSSSSSFWDFPLKVTLESNEPRLIWAAIDSWHNCNELDFPDIPMNAYQWKGITHMISGSTNYHLMQGPTLFNVTRKCGAIWNATQSGDPSQFRDKEWPTSSFVLPNGTVLALVHNEYHGKEHNNCPKGMDYPHCMQFATGILISKDYSNSWNYFREPPDHIIATTPYPYKPTNFVNGWGDPTNIVQNKQDGYYYVAMWNRYAVGLQEAGICILRSKNLIDWKGWNGTHYAVELHVSPYNQDANFNPANHICTVLPYHPILDPNKCNPLGLVFHKTTGLYLMTWTCHKDSFHMTASTDFQNWSHPHTFFDRTRDLNQNTLKHVLGVNYPNLLDPTAGSDDDPNYSTVGDAHYLFFVGSGHSPYSDGRRALALPIKLQLRNNNRDKKQQQQQQSSSTVDVAVANMNVSCLEY